MARVNLSKVSELTAMPKGRYKLSLSSFKVKPAKSSGEMTMYLTFVVVDNEDPSYDGRKVFKNFSLQEQALWALKQWMSIIGADEEVLNDPDGFDTDDFMPQLIGSTCWAYVDAREYPENSGRFNNQIESFINPDDVPQGW